MVMEASRLFWCNLKIVAGIMDGIGEIKQPIFAEDLTYEELLEKLKRRFGGQGMEEKFQTELRCRRRSKGESLRELAQDIRRLMAMAYPGEKSSLSEHLSLIHI